METEWSFHYATPKPEGPLVEMSAEEMERILLQRVSLEQSDPAEALWQLGRFYCQIKRQDRALDCLRQNLARPVDLEVKASCILAMRQTMEQLGETEAAIRFYKEAFALEPTHTRTWYFLHNNLGYCLNVLRRYAEGEAYCRKAIEIDGQRANAFKNLGLALEGQGRFREAAESFIRATQVDAADPRSCDLLERLLRAHPELEYEFAVEAECCRQAVKFATSEAQKVRPPVHRGWRKHLILARMKLRWLIHRRFRSQRD